MSKCNKEILNKIVGESENSWMEMILKLECSCKLGEAHLFEKIIIKLISSGYNLENLKAYTKLRNNDISNCLVNNSNLQADLELIANNFEKELKNDTNFVLINSMYELDQNSRKIALRINDRSIIKIIDSFNLQLVSQMILDKKLNFMKLGSVTNSKFYIVCLHLFRNLEDNQYESLKEALLDKISNNQFDPYSFANIIDERLRFKKDPEYPKYNFLRKESVSEEKNKEILKNRKLINCF